MSSDETYLESFLDTITSLPHEIKRNLELMKDLDKTCSGLTESMKQKQQAYIQNAEEKVMNLEVAVPPPPSPKDKSKKQSGETQLQPGVKVLGGGKDIIIPTTEEMMELITDPDLLEEIRRLQSGALQEAEEKVAIADQTYALVDATVKRLDADLEQMEKLLLSTGEFQAVGTAKPNDLAAIQVQAGSPDWILAKVISHDPQTGIYKLSDEDIESNKIFHLPEAQVVLLEEMEQLARGDIVFAIYPDTTSFYQATVVQPPRKVSGGGNFVMVNFVDDSDEHGITPDRAVLLQHVMLPPYGAMIQ